MFLSYNMIYKLNYMLCLKGKIMLLFLLFFNYVLSQSNAKQLVEQAAEVYSEFPDSSFKLCLEAENENDYKTLELLAKTISNKVYNISSEQRKSLHVAAVFVSNFVNHMYVIGSDVCETNNVPFEVLQPLIQEVANKITTLSPKDAQTGPALRNDTKTIEKHIEFLKDSNYQDIYKLLTQSIQNVAKEL